MAQYLTPGPAPVWVSGGFEVTRIVHGAGTRSGGWQPAVGLNIANLKNKRGEASAPLPTAPAPWDVLLTSSISDKGWGQGPTTAFGIHFLFIKVFRWFKTRDREHPAVSVL